MVGREPCPDANELAAYLGRRSPEQRSEELRAHLDRCAPCQELVALVVVGSQPTGPAADRELTTPAAVGRFVLGTRLGAGGMGVVYQALDPRLERRVAIKLLHPSGDPVRATERLVREAQAMARLSHPNVATVFEVGVEDQLVFVAMELVDGVTLAAWLSERRSWREIVDMFIAAGRGLAAAHRADIVHRDFKPSNVMVGSDGRARVLDFGLALLTPTDQPKTTDRNAQTADHEAIVGTPAYMAPEQRRGDPATALSDQYSFCVALYEALYNTVYARRPSSVAPRTSPPAPARIRAILERGLDDRAEQRFPSMTVLVDALERARASTGGRWRIGAALGAAVLATIAVIAVMAPTAPPDPCDDDSASRALDELTSSPAVAYAAAWRELRTATCRGEQPIADRGDRVHYLDRRALTAVPRFRDDNAAIGAEPWVVQVPYECQTAAAGRLAELEPSDPTTAEQVARVRAELAIGALREREAAATGFAPLRLEVALVAALRDLDAGQPPDRLRTVVSDAVRSDHVTVAAHALILLVGASVERGDNPQLLTDLLTQADTAVSLAGDPPQLRAHWHALNAWLKARASSPTAEVRHAVEVAEAAVADPRVRPTARLYTRLGLARMVVSDLDRSLAWLAKADALMVATAPERDRLTMVLNYATVLDLAGRTDEALARLAPALAVTDKSRFVPTERAAVLAAYVGFLNNVGQQSAALAAIEPWRDAIETLAPARQVVYGRLRLERAEALAALGRDDEAVRDSALALEIYIERFGANTAPAAEARILHGGNLRSLGRYAEAAQQLEQGVTTLAAQTSEDELAVHLARAQLADLWTAQGDPARARPVLERSLAAFRAANDAIPRETTAIVELYLAKALAGHDRARARTLVRSVLEVLNEHGGYATELRDARALWSRLGP